MVFKCCVPHCKSGLVTSKSRRKISFHALPKDSQRRDEWLRAISRDFTLTAHTRVCSLHFHPEDFVSQRQDSNIRRQRGALHRKLLKEIAIPSIFPNYPKYLQRNRRRESSGASSSSQRIEAENLRLETEIIAFEESDVITDLDSLVLKFNESVFRPSNFFLHPSESHEKRIFLNIDLCDVPTLKQSVTVFEDMSFVAVDLILSTR